ncbi:ComF family protein [Plantactinospora sp. GCM10030261]|uniref:ComF family protein n=1 Tax=Plantactinospora sp. GCM10030261 TaxID=3273420 RepID=UPI0036102DAD
MPSDGVLAALADLVLPADCAGCRATRLPLRAGVCASCAGALEALVPHPVRPTPAPAGLPPCTAVGAYQGVLREAVLSYKERGRHRLGRPLGVLLAGAVAAAVGRPRPVLLVPVPATARAARERHGDHMARLARRAVVRLRGAGWPAAATQPLRAMPRPDSTHLDSAARAATAGEAFQVRPGAIRRLRSVTSDATIVLVDDIITTGATLAAIAVLLNGYEVPVRAAAVLAGTVRRRMN